jgi:predicted phosphodiesterase
LPETIKITLPENREIKKICLRHASLNDMETYLYPDTAIADIFLQAGELLVLGHTHHPMLRQAGDGRVLNPGSVGQPRDSLSGASYATVDLISGECIFKRC